MFDLIGAMYSVAAKAGIQNSLMFIIFIGLGFASYFMYHKKLKAESAAA